MTHDSNQTRRKFIQLGAAFLSTAAMSGNNESNSQESLDGPESGAQINLDEWEKLKKQPYPKASLNTPGVVQLNGKQPWPDKNKYANTKKVPGMCQLCSTICGIVGHVKDGRIIKIEGNPNDPNSRGRLCARGQAGLNHQYHPERLLYPLKRVGERGAGQWKRISWDEALDEIGAKLKAIRESGKPENFAFHQGRQRSKDALKRFLDAFGTKTQLSHRSLCSGNRRAK